MRVEVHSAAQFLMNLLRVKQSNPLPETQLESFKGSLEDLLLVRYRSHWYPEVPTKGSGFRCIRINGKMDPIIEQAALAVGLHPRMLKTMLPQELTMWIDPDGVSYRIGENGSICVLYEAALDARSSPSSDLSMSSDEFSMERRREWSHMTVLGYLDEPYSRSPRSQNSSFSSGTGSNSPPLSPILAPPNVNRYSHIQRHQHQQMHRTAANRSYLNHWDGGINNYNDQLISIRR
ncbi:protein BTG2-like [Phlebotomus argentipes]|uniref:protein BTG2-like n=1 Tax=Phlebotomus argentipes TaxID=94469 RepID=UPI0028933710|nr:protein BTG2-like [Phlebotomus argentipes]